VLEQALAPALAAKAAFAVAAEARGGVEHVGRIDPHDPGLDAGGDLERAGRSISWKVLQRIASVPNKKDFRRSFEACTRLRAERFRLGSPR
jgi:hypothetical protein